MPEPTSRRRLRAAEAPDRVRGAGVEPQSSPTTTTLSLAFNADGDFLLGGSHGHRFAIQKVRATDGHKKWRRTLPANSYNGGFATGVAVDAVGDVIAVGGHVTPLPKGHVNGIHSYTVLKACAVNGRVRRTDNCP